VHRRCWHAVQLFVSIDSTPTDLTTYTFPLDISIIDTHHPSSAPYTCQVSITFRMSRRRREMYCGHARLCVCLSAAACPHYCTDPDVTWGNSRGCPLVVHYWADLQLVHGLRCYGNIMQTLVITSLPPPHDMTT